MILFIGQVPSHAQEREAFQEVDYKRFFGDIAKWVVEIDDAARIPEFVTRAFAVATSGRPGPVVISLPEDMLTSEAEAPDAQPYTPVETSPGEHEMQRLEELLAKAERPIAILGGTRWSAEAVGQFQRSAESWALPVGCSFRRQMLFDHLHPSYAGDVGIGPNPKLAEAIKEADLVLLVGGRIGEMPSSDYTLLKSPYPDQTLVHVHPDAGELGRVYRPDARHQRLAARLRRGLRRPRPEGAAGLGRPHRRAARRLSRTGRRRPKPAPARSRWDRSWTHLENVLPDDAIIANGAGNYATWVHRFHRFRRFATQAAPTSGSMGYGMPAGVAAKHLFPEREVIVFAGDGCFLMHGQEFATAVQYDLPIIVVVVNNGIYGTIRMHQERDYPGRVSGTDLKNPDFAASPAPMAAMARRWRRRTSSRRPSSAPATAASRRSSRSSSTPRRSRRPGR